MRYTLEIVGNPDNPTGNPLGYKTCTTKSKWRPEYQRYEQWKEYVRGAFIRKYGESLDLLKIHPLSCNGKELSIHIVIEWSDGRHPDNTNVLKGIEDSLLENDKCVTEQYTRSKMSDDKVGKLFITLEEHERPRYL